MYFLISYYMKFPPVNLKQENLRSLSPNLVIQTMKQALLRFKNLYIISINFITYYSTFLTSHIFRFMYFINMQNIGNLSTFIKRTPVNQIITKPTTTVQKTTSKIVFFFCNYLTFIEPP